MKSLELLKNEINLVLVQELFDNSNDHSISFFYNNFITNPKETLYYVCFLLEKNVINKESFFQIIDSFIFKKNYEKFIYDYLFLSFKPLNDYLLSKIENKLYYKTLSLIFFKNDKLQKIKKDMFDSYCLNKQIEESISFCKSNELNLDYFLLETYGKGTSNFNETKHYNLHQLMICSAFTKNIKELLNYFFSYIPYTFESFKYNQINSDSLQCKLIDIDPDVKYASYIIYKNIFLNEINTLLKQDCNKFVLRNFYLETEAILLFLLSHDLFSEDEIKSFFLYIRRYVNLEEHFSNIRLHSFSRKNLNILSHFIFLSIKYNQEHILLNLGIFFSNSALNSQFILRTLLLLSKEDYIFLNSFINKKQIYQSVSLFLISFVYQDGLFEEKHNKSETFKSFLFFYQEDLISAFLDHFKYLDEEVYNLIIEDHQQNLFILKYYFKNQIENF